MSYEDFLLVKQHLTREKWFDIQFLNYNDIDFLMASRLVADDDHERNGERFDVRDVKKMKLTVDDEKRIESFIFFINIHTETGLPYKALHHHKEIMKSKKFNAHSNNSTRC
ncbi:hypothetical protein SNEBB_011412 [Seison nebaliae]|nr:hypothetical protein SNEBB_011412 [Seison nebaliae]